jgi:acyl dehydratase
MMGLFLEETEVGRCFELGAHHFTEDSMRAFSGRFVPVGFHVDEAEARSGMFGGRVAAGWHVCCGWMACFVETNLRERAKRAAEGRPLPEIGPSPGLTNLRWPEPVRAGDDICYSIEFTGKRALNTRPAWGMVTIAARGAKADGTLVMAFSGNVMVARRSVDMRCP